MVYMTDDNVQFEQLTNDSDDDARVLLCAGGQEGEYAKRFVVDLDAALGAVRHYIREGEADHRCSGRRDEARRPGDRWATVRGGCRLQRLGGVQQQSVHDGREPLQRRQYERGLPGSGVRRRPSRRERRRRPVGLLPRAPTTTRTASSCRRAGPRASRARTGPPNAEQTRATRRGADSAWTRGSRGRLPASAWSGFVNASSRVPSAPRVHADGRCRRALRAGLES